MLRSNVCKIDRRSVLKAGAAISAAGLLPAISAFGKSEKPVRIGQIQALTGTRAALGKNGVRGAELAVQQINAKGGILGRPVELLVEDGAFQPTLALQKANKLVELEKANFLIGATSSSVALALSQTALQLKTIYIDTAAHVDAVTGSECNWCTFRTCSTSWMLAAGDSRTLFNKFGKRWYFITPDYAFGHSEQQAYAEQLESYGGEVVGNALAPVGTTDFSSYLIKAKLAHPDVLMVLPIGEGKVDCLKQVTQFGFQKEMAVGGGEIDLEGIAELPVEARIGWWTMEWYWNQPKVPHVEAFVDTYGKQYGGEVPTARSWFGFATVYALALAAEKAKSVESIKVARALEGLELPPEVALQPGRSFYRAGDHQMIANEFPGEVRQHGKYPDLFKLAELVPGAKIAKSVAADGCKLVYPS